MAELPKIEKDNTGQGVGLADAPSVLGKARKKTKNLPNTLMSPQPKEDGRRKDNIIQFPSDRISNNKKPPISREDCCEKTVTLLKEISKSSAIDDNGQKKQSSGKEKSETNKLLKEMNATLKSMLNIQAAEFQGTLEAKNEKKPGLGGVVEKINQEADSLMKLIGEGILMLGALTIGPLITAIDKLVNFLGDVFGQGSDTQKGMNESGTGLENVGEPIEYRKANETKEEYDARRKKTPLELENEAFHAKRKAEKEKRNGTTSSSKDGVNPYGSAVKDLIARGESSNDKKGGGYNSANKPSVGGKPNEAIVVDGLKDKTIKEVQAMQSKGEIFAAGKYQIIPETLKEGVAALKLTGDEKFDESMQEKLYDSYLTGSKAGRENINAFKQGKSNDVDAAARDIAKEFASAPDPSTGASYYDKDGINKSSISVEEIRAALLEDQQAFLDSQKAKENPWLKTLNANLDKIKDDAIKTAAAQTNNKQTAAAPSVTNNTTVNQGEKKSPSVNTFAPVDPDMSSVIRAVGQF